MITQLSEKEATMSRTWKDVPKKAQVKKLLKKRIQEHDHQHYNFERTVIDEEEIRIPKVDAAEVHAMRQQLLTDNADFREFEEPAKEKIEEVLDEHSEIIRVVSHIPKMIVFVVRSERSVGPWVSDYCTDYEFYDYNSGRDLRDGGYARCVSDAPYGKASATRSRCQCTFCQMSYKNHLQKYSISFSPRKIAQAYNNGFFDDVCDEYDMW